VSHRSSASSLSRADLRTLGKVESRVYHHIAADLYSVADFWRVGFEIPMHTLPPGTPIYRKGGRRRPPQRRIDLVYRVKSLFHVVELKPHLSPAAVGQVFLYSRLLRDYFDLSYFPVMHLAAFSMDPDLSLICSELNILTDIYSDC